MYLPIIYHSKIYFAICEVFLFSFNISFLKYRNRFLMIEPQNKALFEMLHNPLKVLLSSTL